MCQDKVHTCFGCKMQETLQHYKLGIKNPHVCMHALIYTSKEKGF